MEIIRLFAESAVMRVPVEAAENPDPVVEAARQKALGELVKSWPEDGDDREQKESWEMLKKALGKKSDR